MYNYSSCRESYDGKFLVPDSVSMFPLKEVENKLHAEIFEHWQDYKSITSSNVNAGILQLGKFSAEIQAVREKEQLYNTITARTMFRQREYEVKLDIMSELHPAFKSRVYEIASYAQRGDVQQAVYLSENLVKDYGTHYITSVNVGAVLVKLDYLSRSYMETSDKKAISAVASLTFPAVDLIRKIIDVGGATSQATRDVESYRHQIMKLEIFTMGGALFNPNFNMSEWLADIPNNMVVVDRHADLLHGAIIPSLFPELRPETTNMVSSYIRNATDKYINNNQVARPNFIHTKRQHKAEAPNLNGYNAISHIITGIQEKCIRSVDNSHLRHTLVSLTGVDCLAGAEHRQVELYSVYYSSEDCTLTTIWCTDLTPSHNTRSYLFGGYYSNEKDNPVTGSKSCKPNFYTQYLLYGWLKICLSSDYELAMPNAIAFGGFFSCQYGNPLASSSTNESLYSTPQLAPHDCPEGYTAHLMITWNTCDFHVCLESGLFSAPTFTTMNLKLPPFTNIHEQHESSEFGSDTLQVQGSGGITLTRNVQGLWEQASDWDSSKGRQKDHCKRPLEKSISKK